MTDTGIRYTHCRGPHCGGRKLLGGASALDGLCSGTDASCFESFNAWRMEHAKRALFEGSYASVEWSVAIDQWLEAGAP